MPLYNYTCSKCNERFDLRHSYTFKEAVCTKCKSTKIVKNLVRFNYLKKEAPLHPLKTGEVVHRSIKDNKEEMNKYKHQLKKEAQKGEKK